MNNKMILYVLAVIIPVNNVMELKKINVVLVPLIVVEFLLPILKVSVYVKMV